MSWHVPNEPHTQKFWPKPLTHDVQDSRKPNNQLPKSLKIQLCKKRALTISSETQLPVLRCRCICFGLFPRFGWLQRDTKSKTHILGGAPKQYIYIYLDPQKGTFFCSLRFFCSFCQLSGISEIYAETANFMFRTHVVANPANLATRNARKTAENARKSAENARKSEENARKSAESPKPTCFEHGWSNRNVCFLGK